MAILDRKPRMAAVRPATHPTRIAAHGCFRNQDRGQRGVPTAAEAAAPACGSPTTLYTCHVHVSRPHEPTPL
eukprot:5091371-Prymnesium_polylepis.1